MTAFATPASRLALALALALAWVSLAGHAAPPVKFLKSAGPPPTDAKVRLAIFNSLLRTDPDLDRRKPFKILSGPTLATGNTFGRSLEQAWLMCLVVNVKKRGPGPQDIAGRPLYLRTSPAGDVVVVPLENWQDSSPQC